jgi:hypothetical protein
MLAKTKIVLGVAIVLGTASVALARGGGGVMRCSLDGINPVYHKAIFGRRHHDVARQYGFVQLADRTWRVDSKVCGRA